MSVPNDFCCRSWCRALSYYAPASLAISIVALTAHFSAEPYTRSADHWFQAADLGGVTLYFMLAVSPPGDSATNVLAWAYWLFALCYTAAVVIALALPLVARVRTRLCGTAAAGELEGEQAALLPPGSMRQVSSTRE